MILDKKLNSGSKIILDGGTGSEVEKKGGKMSSAWGALANIYSSEIVINIHEEFINSGCDIITTNTYATSRHCLEAEGHGDKTIEINKMAVNNAKRAIEKADCGRPIAIAGSMSSHYALSKNEFRPDPKFVPSLKQVEKNYKEIATILCDSGVDFLLLEAVLDIEHAQLLLNAALELKLPVWVGISCCINKFDNSVIGRNFLAEKTPHLINQPNDLIETPKFLPKDEIISLDKIINSLTIIGGDVYGIMHSNIEDTNEALTILKQNWRGPMMIYPEIHFFDTKTGGAIITASKEEYVNACMNWLNSGIQIIGGCCGVSSNYIRELKESINY